MPTTFLEEVRTKKIFVVGIGSLSLCAMVAAKVKEPNSAFYMTTLGSLRGTVVFAPH